jgi:hypothetical protein
VGQLFQVPPEAGARRQRLGVEIQFDQLGEDFVQGAALAAQTPIKSRASSGS